MSLKVFACIDASPYAEAVCDGAIWAAKALTAPLGLVHVIDRAQHTQTPDLSGSIGLGSQEVLLQQLAELDEQHSKLALQRGHHILDAAHARATAAAVAEISEVMRHGPLLESLKALQDDTRLLVLGKRGLSSTDAHGQLGMHIEMIIRSMQKPILLTQQRFSAPKRVMLAYDGSATAQKSLEMLAASPLCRGLPVHLVMAAVPSEQAEKQLAEAASVLTLAGFDTRTAIVTGEPDEALHQYQQEQVIDLLVMGAYGHSRIRQFILGSTTTAMLSKARCAMLVLR